MYRDFIVDNNSLTSNEYFSYNIMEGTEATAFLVITIIPKIQTKEFTHFVVANFDQHSLTLQCNNYILSFNVLPLS